MTCTLGLCIGSELLNRLDAPGLANGPIQRHTHRPRQLSRFFVQQTRIGFSVHTGDTNPNQLNERTPEWHLWMLRREQMPPVILGGPARTWLQPDLLGRAAAAFLRKAKAVPAIRPGQRVSYNESGCGDLQPSQIAIPSSCLGRNIRSSNLIRLFLGKSNPCFSLETAAS